MGWPVQKFCRVYIKQSSAIAIWTIKVLCFVPPDYHDMHYCEKLLGRGSLHTWCKHLRSLLENDVRTRRIKSDIDSLIRTMCLCVALKSVTRVFMRFHKSHTQRGYKKLTCDFTSFLTSPIGYKLSLEFRYTHRLASGLNDHDHENGWSPSSHSCFLAWCCCFIINNTYNYPLITAVKLHYCYFVTTKLHYIVCEQLLFSFSTSPSSCMHFAFKKIKIAILSLLQTRNVWT